MAEAALGSVDFRHKFGPWPVGFQICSPGIIIMAPRHVAIIHTDQMRPETYAAGRWRKLTEVGGIRKWKKHH